MPEIATAPPKMEITISWSTIFKILVAILLAYIAVRLWPFTELLLLALLIALAFRPLLQWVERRGWPKWVGVTASALLLFGFVIALILLIVPSLAHQVSALVKNLPNAKEQALHHLPTSGPIHDLAEGFFSSPSVSDPEPLMRQVMTWGPTPQPRALRSIWGLTVAHFGHELIRRDAITFLPPKSTTKPPHHQTMQSTFAKLASLAFGAILALGAVSTVTAEDKAPDATGKWTWTVPGRDGGAERKMTLALKQEGEKLTGKLSSPGRDGGEARETEITDGSVKGADVAFSVTREFNGNKRTSKYTGKLTGDAITGKVESKDREGNDQARDWSAKKEAK